MSVEAFALMHPDRSEIDQLATTTAKLPISVYEQPAPVAYNEYTMLLLKTEHQTFVAKISSLNNQYAFVESPENGQQITDTVSVETMVRKIVEVFGVNKVQLADILHISRPTLYNHIQEREIPNSLDQYQFFYTLALDIEKTITPSLKPGLKSVLVAGKTLLAHLKSAKPNADSIMSYAKVIAERIENRPLTSRSSTEQQRRNTRRYTKVG